jgi:hypothetical protein
MFVCGGGEGKRVNGVNVVKNWATDPSNKAWLERPNVGQTSHCNAGAFKRCSLVNRNYGARYENVLMYFACQEPARATVSRVQKGIANRLKGWRNKAKKAFKLSVYLARRQVDLS